MKVIIAGSRGVTDFDLVESAIQDSGFQIDQVVSGMAPGVDLLGVVWARRNGVAYRSFYAAWRTADGQRNMKAGFERNLRMADYADGLIAVWDGFSGGTAHMIRTMQMREKPVYYVDLDAL